MDDCLVYFFTGFLDSGKTSVICSWIGGENFKNRKVVVINTEEGEEEYIQENYEGADPVVINCDTDDVNKEMTFDIEAKYKPGVVFLTLRLCLTLLLMPYETKALELYQSLFANAASLDDAAFAAAQQQLFAAITPVYIGVGILLVLAIVSALLADRLYLSYVRRSIETAKEQQGRDAFLLQFFKRGGVSPLLGILSYMLASFVPSMIYTFINR